MQKSNPKYSSPSHGPPTVLVIDGDDSDEDDLEAPPFSPISVDENIGNSDLEHDCSVGDPDTASFDDWNDTENATIDDLVIN